MIKRQRRNIIVTSKGFETALPIFNSSGDSISIKRIFVEGRESVVTPAGTFNAWKVAYGNNGSEIFYWISDDSRRYPVKMTRSPISESFFELASISKYEKNRPIEYADQNISLFLPPGWFHLTSGGGGYTNEERWTFISICDPLFETYSNIGISRGTSIVSRWLSGISTVCVKVRNRI